MFRFLDTTIRAQWHSQKGGRGMTAPPGRVSAPLLPLQMKLHFVQRSMESCHFESQSAPLLTPQSPLATPSFWKVWLCPCQGLILHFLTHRIRRLVRVVIHRFPNLNFINIPKINRSTRPSHYKACWSSWKFIHQDWGTSSKTISLTTIS